jgi:hypothetical protein
MGLGLFVGEKRGNTGTHGPRPAASLLAAPPLETGQQVVDNIAGGIISV